jgi:hypothetical protein
MAMKPGLKFEKKLAREFNGRLQPGSGAPWGVKGDIEMTNGIPDWWNGLLVEAKDTANKSFRVSDSVWGKIQNEAASEGKLGIMMVDLAGNTLAVVDYQVLMQLLNTVEKYQSGEYQIFAKEVS